MRLPTNEFRFIAKLYYININTRLNKGKQVFDELRISNSNALVEQKFNDIDFVKMIGLIERNILNDATYFYAIGKKDTVTHTFASYDTREQCNSFLDYYMALGQLFNTMLWVIKDHSINTEIGFLYLYNDNANSNQVTSNQRSPVFTNASGETVETKFSPEEIDEAIKLMSLFNKDRIRSLEAAKSYDRVHKVADRIGRFHYFLQTARSEGHLPIKIAHYCTMLETLLSTDSAEITHKISERAARILGESVDERINIFNTIKKVYKIRSNTVHGAIIEDKLYKQIKALSVSMDDLLRRLYRKIISDSDLHKIFSQGNKNELDEWFTKLILQ